MNKKPQKNTPLSLLGQFIEKFFESDAQSAPLRYSSPAPTPGSVLRPNPKSGALDQSRDWVRGAACQDLAAELFEKLPKEAPFQAPEELCSVLWGALTDLPPDAARADIPSILQAAIENSALPWQFDIRLAEVHALSLELDIDEERQLAIYSKTIREVPTPTVLNPTVDISLEFEAVHLRGLVIAASEEGGLIAVEALGSTLLGAAHAMGLVRVSHREGSLAGASSVVLGRPQDPPRRTAVPPTLQMFSGCSTSFPIDLSEIEKQNFEHGAPLKAVERHLRILKRLLAIKGDEADAIRRACRAAFTAARTRDYGLAVTLAFTVIEGLLLSPSDSSDTTARLAEALAHSLGRTTLERDALRSDAKQLYKERSAFIHRGASREKAQGRRHALHLMNRVLRREMEALTDPEALERT